MICGIGFEICPALALLLATTEFMQCQPASQLSGGGGCVSCSQQ